MSDEIKKTTAPKKVDRSKKQVELSTRQRQTIVDRLCKIVAIGTDSQALRAALKLVSMDAKSQTLVEKEIEK